MICSAISTPNIVCNMTSEEFNASYKLQIMASTVFTEILKYFDISLFVSSFTLMLNNNQVENV